MLLLQFNHFNLGNHTKLDMTNLTEKNRAGIVIRNIHVIENK